MAGDVELPTLPAEGYEPLESWRIENMRHTYTLAVLFRCLWHGWK